MGEMSDLRVRERWKERPSNLEIFLIDAKHSTIQTNCLSLNVLSLESLLRHKYPQLGRKLSQWHLCQWKTG